MDLDLGKEVVYKITFKGETYKMREPTYEDVQTHTKALNKDPDNPDLLINYLENLGLPSKFTKTLGVSKIKTICDKITGGFDDKKK